MPLRSPRRPGAGAVSSPHDQHTEPPRPCAPQPSGQWFPHHACRMAPASGDLDLHGVLSVISNLKRRKNEAPLSRGNFFFFPGKITLEVAGDKVRRALWPWASPLPSLSPLGRGGVGPQGGCGPEQPTENWRDRGLPPQRPRSSCCWVQSCHFVISYLNAA